jgi:hypothetical protein
LELGLNEQMISGQLDPSAKYGEFLFAKDRMKSTAWFSAFEPACYVIKSLIFPAFKKHGTAFLPLFQTYTYD